MLFMASSAQDIEWEKSFGGKHSDYLFDAIPTADYGFILAGSSLSKKTGGKTEDNNGDLDYWVWKMNEHGEADWQKTFGGSGMDLLQSIRLTNDGGFILAGSSDSGEGLQKKAPARGKSDFWVIKLDGGGGEQWQVTLGGSGQEKLQSVVPTSDGGYILGGTSASPRSRTGTQWSIDPSYKLENCYGSTDYWVVKINSGGRVEWQRTIGGQYVEELRSIIQSKDGGYILAGSSNSEETGNKNHKSFGISDYFIVKLDREGNQLWQRSFGGTGDDQLYVIHQAYDGNYIAAGNSSSPSSGNKTESNVNGTDFWIVKFSEEGKIIWQETYNNGSVDLLTSLVENDDHSLLLGGYSRGEATGTSKKEKAGINDYVAVKVAEDGDEKWTETFGSNGQDILRKAIETRDGGYLLAGTSNGAVSGDKTSGVGRNDFWVVKLKDKDKKKPDKQLIEAIPNPAFDYTNVIIGYDFTSGTATVVDIAGHILQQIKIDSRTVPIDLSNYPEGIYVINIKTNVQSDGVKVIKRAK
jgi:hypothetical protein